MTKRQNKILTWLLERPGYLKKSAVIVYDLCPRSLVPIGRFPDFEKAFREAKKQVNTKRLEENEEKLKSFQKIISKSNLNKLQANFTELDNEINVDKLVLPVKKITTKLEVSAENKITEDKAEQLIEEVKHTKDKQLKFKRLFFDIETSPNVVFSWNVGYKLNIPHDNILKERAIICICWKFAGENKVHELHWNQGEDKQVLEEFIKVLNSADEIIGHNSDNYDLKWIRTRCIFHGIPTFPDYTQIDTLKLARQGFRFNSNKLDYIGGFLGVGKKMDTGGFGLWKDIILDNSVKAMNKMIKYCKVDVIRLEQIYDKLNPHSKHKTHVGVLLGGDKCNCVNCGSDKTIRQGTRYTATGIPKIKMQCNNCHKNFTVSNLTYLNRDK